MMHGTLTHHHHYLSCTHPHVSCQYVAVQAKGSKEEHPQEDHLPRLEELLTNVITLQPPVAQASDVH